MLPNRERLEDVAVAVDDQIVPGGHRFPRAGTTRVVRTMSSAGRREGFCDGFTPLTLPRMLGDAMRPSKTTPAPRRASETGDQSRLGSLQRKGFRSIR